MKKSLINWPLSSARSINYQYFQQISGSIDVTALSADAKIKVELKLNSGGMVERFFPLSVPVVE